MLETKLIIDKNKIVEKYNNYNYFKSSIRSLKSENFKIFRSKDYSKKIKFSIITIIYDSENDELFFKNINSVLSQTLDNIEFVIINNGAKDSLLNRLDQLLNGFKNISIIINPIPQFEKDIVSLYCPVIALANLGLALSRGTLFTWLSWDDEINKNYCESIYRTYLESGYKCFSPIPKAIDLDSLIIEKETKIFARSFESFKDSVSAIDIIKSKISPNPKSIFLSPGELLCYEREFLISRQGIDYDVDISQYLRVSVGEEIALVREAVLLWRYHPNQAHHVVSSYCNKSHIKRIKDLYEITNIYQIYLNHYGKKWAKKIKKYYEIHKIVDLLSTHIILLINNKTFKPIKFFREIKSEINIKLFIFVIMTLIRFYFRKFTYLFNILIKKPKKIFKINKYLKF